MDFAETMFGQRGIIGKVRATSWAASACNGFPLNWHRPRDVGDILAKKVAKVDFSRTATKTGSHLAGFPTNLLVSNQPGQ